ncbi:MAG: DUF2207 domain-containing protein [Desulfuromonas sp.]|nr:MAG: DUF2207 domain-containing protein [Desulfuromonas sp.]
MTRPILLLCCWLLLTTPAIAVETILDFHSDIRVETSGSMVVTETVRVTAEGKSIKRGIYRDFPTDYTDRYGNRYRVGFDLLSVQRDGKREEFHTERRSNGLRIYIGSKNRRLKPGTYSYQLRYRTDRQLGFFEQHDELYWNVTGNDWAFPIDQAGASVSLPAGISARDIGVEAYTGPTGSKGQNYRADVDDAGVAHFTTTRKLRPKEGLTIVVTWPKGFVHEPTRGERADRLLRDNRHLVIALGGLLLIIGYYLAVWWRVGRDPEAGVVFPHYIPPSGFSPASMRYIRRMDYDHKAFASALVNLAVKGLVEIEEEGASYRLTRTSLPAKELAPGEKTLLSKLFAGGMTLQLKNRNHRRIKAALTSHKNALSNNFEKLYFLSNRRWFIPGALLSLVAIVGSVISLPVLDDIIGLAFITVWLTFWSFGVFALLRRVVQLWRGADSAAGVMGAVIISLFALPFLGGEIFGIYFFISAASWPLFIIFALTIGANLLFAHLLKSPTRAGRQLLDKIEGFRLYLDVAEAEDMRLRNKPDQTPELFEKYLPYALALDLEQAWAEQFADMFADLEQRGESYRPVWYTGHRWSSGNLGAFGSSLGSTLSGAISSSSSAPGSSSGSGGGGSSGGGGGGGGGGGW